MTRQTSRTGTFFLIPLVTLGLVLTCAFLDVGVAHAADQKAALSKIKVLPYNEVKWDEARSATLNRIKTIIQDTR